MDAALLSQALVRAGRTLVAGLIASAITLLPQVLIDAAPNLDPIYSGAVILGITTFLNGLGKALRAPTIEVTDVDAANAAVAASPDPVATVKSGPIPF